MTNLPFVRASDTSSTTGPKSLPMVLQPGELHPSPAVADSLVRDADLIHIRILRTAIAALQHITQTSETLSLLSEGAARELIAEMAGELRPLADQLHIEIGELATEDEQFASGAPSAEQFVSRLTAVRRALVDVRSATAEARTAPGKPRAAESQDPNGAVPAASASSEAATMLATADDAANAHLFRLASAVNKLTETARRRLVACRQLEDGVSDRDRTLAQDDCPGSGAEEPRWPFDLSRRCDDDSDR